MEKTLNYRDLFSVAYMGHTVKNKKGKKLTWRNLELLKEVSTTLIVLISPISDNDNLYQIL
jgi:hypothetical protein